MYMLYYGGRDKVAVLVTVLLGRQHRHLGTDYMRCGQDYFLHVHVVQVGRITR